MENERLRKEIKRVTTYMFVFRIQKIDFKVLILFPINSAGDRAKFDVAKKTYLCQRYFIWPC